MKLRIQLSKTAVGTATYVQITSDDQLTVNIVLVAEAVEVRDDRHVPVPQRPRRKNR